MTWKITPEMVDEHFSMCAIMHSRTVFVRVQFSSAKVIVVMLLAVLCCTSWTL